MELGAAAPTPRVAPASDYAAGVAEQAAAAALHGDWGAVFVYGSMTLPQSWDALIGRMPEMRVAKLRGYVRRRVHCGGFAALVERERGLVIGQMVTGLRPVERRLLDRVVDDGFALSPVSVRCLDDFDGKAVECTTYVWREEFEDALDGEQDWDVERFTDESLDEFVELCADMRKSQHAEDMSDKELRELVQAHRRCAPEEESE